MKPTKTTAPARLLCEDWNLLHAAEKLQALDLVRRWAQEDAAGRAETPQFGWMNRYADLLAERFGETAAAQWQATMEDATTPDGMDARESLFIGVATETWLRRQSAPRAAARGLLRRGGQRTVTPRSRRALVPATA